MRKTFLSGMVVFVLILGIVSPASAGAYTQTPLTVISGPSPFAGCTVGAFDNGVVFVNAEEEPWVDVNPTNPNNIIAVWQQDRWTNGGAHGLVAGVTFDGGQTWTRTFAPFSYCAGGTAANGGDFERSSDPWVTFSPNGTAYQISLSVSFSTGESAILTSRSTNGGLTWSNPRTLIRDSGGRDSSYAFNDKESITADSTDSRYAYAVWDRFVTPAGTSKASLPGYFNSRSFRQPVWFSRTTDGGATWESARNIYDPSEFNGTIGNQIVVLPNSDLIDVFDEFIAVSNTQGRRGESVAFIRSKDKGATWSKKSTVIAANLYQGAFDPDTGLPTRAEGGIPEIAVDRSSGALYAVWQDNRFSGVDEIALSTSTDGGVTWSAPIKVNQTPRSSVAGNQQAFVPSVHVAADGTVAVTYYDFRNNDSNPGLPTDYWAVHCHPTAPGGCSSAANWGNELRLSNSSFDTEQAPPARGPTGYFLGDYEGLTSVGNSFVPVFIQVNNGNPTNRTDTFELRLIP